MPLFVLNTILALLLTVYLLQCKSSNDRGTNTVTRFVRDVRANRGYNTVLMLSTSLTVVTLLLGTKYKCMYACIPSLLVIILSFILKNKSTKNKQRIEDSRVVTKTGGKIVAIVLPAVVALIAVICTGGGALVPIAIVALVVAIAKGVSNVVNKSVDMMSDVKGPDITKEDFKELNAVTERISGIKMEHPEEAITTDSKLSIETNVGSMAGITEKFSGISIEHPEEFIEAANRAGIETNGKDLREVASNVIQFAPPAMLAELPKEMSVEEKAMAIMSGTVEVVSTDGKEIIAVET